MPDHPHLTTRQRQILRMIAEGKCGKEMAWELGISERTVEFHRTRLQERLDVHGIADLTRYAIEHRLITAKRRKVEPI